MTDEMRKARLQEQNSQDWYEIEVEGQFNPGWFDRLDGWEIALLPNGNTLLSGWLPDQPALHGLFARIRDLNIKIISLKKCARQQFDETQRIKKQD
jgi:hypothetical protein